MDELLFIDLAKTKADASNVGSKLQQDVGLSKADTAAALDYRALADRAGFRGAVALAAAVLVNGAFLSAIEQTALEARTPAGEVIVAELDPESLDLYAQTTIETRAQTVAFRGAGDL